MSSCTEVVQGWTASTPVPGVKLTTARRDSTGHQAMAPLVFLPRHIDGKIYGIEFCEHFGSCGSRS